VSYFIPNTLVGGLGALNSPNPWYPLDQLTAWVEENVASDPKLIELLDATDALQGLERLNG